MNQHEIMDEMTKEEHDILTDPKSTPEDIEKAWLDAAKRCKANDEAGSSSDLTVVYLKDIWKELQQLNKNLVILNKTLSKRR